MSKLRFASTNQLKMKNSEDKLVEIQIDELENGEKVLHEEVDKDEKDSVEKVRLLEEVENGEKDPKDKVQKKKKKKSIPEDNPNAYATKKTAIQTLLDVALLTKSCKMLKVYTQHYQPNKAGSMIAMIVMASIAILLQIASGILFIIIGRWNWDEEQKRPRLNQLNNASMILVFIIVLLEVIMGVFDDTENLLK